MVRVVYSIMQDAGNDRGKEWQFIELEIKVTKASKITFATTLAKLPSRVLSTFLLIWRDPVPIDQLLWEYSKGIATACEHLNVAF